MRLSHRDRLLACIKGDQSLDRPPVALWRHFPVDDQSPGTLADATLAFQQQFDFDFIKVTPASSYCLKDWGSQDKWEGSSEGTRAYQNKVIRNKENWEKLSVLDPYKSKHLSQHLDCLRLIRKNISCDTPILQTIFSPLAQAKNLAGREGLLAGIRLYPALVSRGLAVIAESTRKFIEAVIDIGIDGIFYAIQHAQVKELSLAEYKTFGIPNDSISLEPAKNQLFNLIHLHGENLYFDILPYYGTIFSIVNWHDQETPPSLSEAKSIFNGVVCGGINQKNMVYNTKNQILREARLALEKTNGTRHILSTGCVFPIITSYGNIMAIRNSVEKAET